MEIGDPKKSSRLRLGNIIIVWCWRNMDLQWISKFLKIKLYVNNTLQGGNMDLHNRWSVSKKTNLLDSVVVLNVPAMQIRLLVEEQEPLSVRGVGVEKFLAGH